MDRPSMLHRYLFLLTSIGFLEQNIRSVKCSGEKIPFGGNLTLIGDKQGTELSHGRTNNFSSTIQMLIGLFENSSCLNKHNNGSIALNGSKTHQTNSTSDINNHKKVNRIILNQKDCKSFRTLIKSLKEGRGISGTAIKWFKSYHHFVRSMTMQHEATEPRVSNCANNTCIVEMEYDEATR